jgi:hypothetical protein
LQKIMTGRGSSGIPVRSHIIGKNGHASLVTGRQVSMRSTPLMVVAASLAIAAIAWAIPFEAPMAWSYWASGLWCAIAIGAIAIHGKRGLWVVLGAPLALWHIAFAAFIDLAWR